MQPIMRYEDGLWPNLLAHLYTFVGYGVGVWLLTVPSYLLNAAGVLLLAHALVISAYLIHELAHFTVFKSHRMNTWMGVVMSWLNGACYASFEGLRRKHLSHHADRADVITFDWRAFLNASPRWFVRLVMALEWLYIPAVELIMHGFVIALPFYSSYHKGDRAKVIAIIVVRAALFAGLAAIAPKAVFLYALAYMIFLTVMRFMDAYQHTYEAYPILDNGQMPQIERKGRDYEYQNTYSNLISLRHPWLNLLTLNFAYHNAHHQKASVPWYRLPALHRELYGEQEPQVLPAVTLLHGYHRDRVRRVVDPSYGEVHAGGDRVADFYGAYGVSFLTAV